MYNIDNYNFLYKPNRGDEENIYYGESYKLFQTNEFEWKTRSIDWIASNIVQASIDLIVDLVNIGQIEVEFEEDNKTEYFKNLLKKGWSQTLEKAVRDMKVYGDSCLLLAIENDINVAYNKTILNAYNICPKNIYADYDNVNPERGAVRYTSTHEKASDNNTYLLLISYYAGRIEYEAYNLNTNIQVDPMTQFTEYFSDDLLYIKEGLKYIYETNLDYNILTYFENKKRHGEYYGLSDITTPVISKLQLIDRMYNLADRANTNNADPERIYSQSTKQIIDQVINEVQQKNNGEINTIPNTLTSTVHTSRRPGVSRIASFIRKMVRNKSTFYSVDDGRGTDRYLVNDYKLDDLYELIDRSKREIYMDLYVSPLLFDPEINTGNISGTAIKRLMSRTVQHIANIRTRIQSHIAQFAFSALQLAKNAELSDVNYGDMKDLPQINWPDIKMDEIKDIIAKYKEAVAIRPSNELKIKAVSAMTGLDLQSVEAMQPAPTFRETLQNRVNGGGNNN